MRAAIAVCGLFAAVACERAHAPELAPVPPAAPFHAIVTIDRPGRTADELERNVLVPAEHELEHLPGAIGMRGEARAGRVRLAIAFAGDADPAAARAAVVKQSAIETVALVGDGDAVLRFTLRSETVTLAGIRDAAERVVVPALGKLGGVAVTTICGSGTSRIEIRAAAAALAASGLGVVDVENAVNAASAVVQASVDGLRGLVIATRNGAPVKLADLASVVDGVAPPACLAADEHGRVIAGAVYLAPRTDRAAARHSVEAALAAARATLPAGVELTILPAEPPATTSIDRELADVADEASELTARARAVAGAAHVLVERGATGGPDEPELGVTTVRTWPGTIGAADVKLIGLRGGDAAALHAARGVIEQAFAGAGGARVVGAVGDAHELAIDYQVDGASAHSLGLASADIDETLAALAGARAVGTIRDATPIVLVLDHATAADVTVRAASGAAVPLAAIARASSIDRVRAIVHVDGQRYVGVRVEAAGDGAQLRAAIAQLAAKLPPGVHASLDEAR